MKKEELAAPTWPWRSKVALVPFPSQGHVSPMVQLASALKRLGFHPIIINPISLHSQLSCTSDANHEEDGNGVVFMPIPDGLDVDQPRDFVTISHAMDNVMPQHLEQLLRSFGESMAFVIVDVLASWAIDVANRCRIPVAGFWPAMYATYSIVNAIPHFIKEGLLSGIDGSPLVEEIASFLPSIPRLKATHLPWLVGNNTSRLFRFKFWLATLERSSSLDLILVNSFSEENHQAHDIISQITCPSENPMLPSNTSTPTLLHVGPLTSHIDHNPSFREEDDSCITWLAKQKPGSVIYVSFGSWVNLTDQQQIAELAMALEDSGRPFLWVLSTGQQANLLPLQFQERVGRRGKVVDWAPQREVLETEAVGCFLTHCGWNSTMEAVIAAKPMLCWPLSGDQFVNCEFIAHVWKVGIKLEGKKKKDLEKGIMMERSEWEELENNILVLRKMVTGISRDVGTMKKLVFFAQALMNKEKFAEGYKF